MKFICPRCGVEDEVIGDNQPRCLVCGAALTKAAAGYTDLLMSPNVAIRRFETVIRTHRTARATSGGFKQEREAWISAVWALGLREITGKEYWIEIETREPTPDCKVHHIDQSAGYNRIVTHNVEVAEWDEHRSDVMEIVRQKCGRAYPQYFVLIVLARNGEQIEILSTSQQIKELQSPFGEIWILGRVSQFSSSYSMFMLYPGTKLIEFDLFDVFRRNGAQFEFLQRGRRSKRTKVHNLRLTYLPMRIP